MATPDLSHLNGDTTSQLRQAVRQADSGTYLVEPRVIRRLVRELYGFARLSPRVPHTEVRVVPAADIRHLTHPDELGIETFDALPDPVVVIALPEEHEITERSTQDQMVLVWRRLFHGAIDRAIRDRIDTQQLTRAQVQAHIDSIGQVEFDEAHAVLASEQRLIHPESRIEAFSEFIAIWWELRAFAPDLIPTWFPSLASRHQDELIPDIGIDPNLLYVASRLVGAPEPGTTSQVVLDEAQLSGVRQDWIESDPVRPSRGRYQRLQRRRQRAVERGNTVAAGLLAMYGAESATTNQQRDDALQTAEDDVRTLVTRLQQALTFEDSDVTAWHESVRELFRNSTHGFWNVDKKLLHDLQKVCLDHERVTYRVDLVKWIVSRGQRPLRRPLTNIREVMMAKHLVSSASRLVYVRLSGGEREQLAGLLHEAADLAEDQMRHRMRSTLRQTLLEVGFRPGNVPEQVAFDKLIEESLDCIAYRGYLTMGDLRDAISRNDLKLADLTDPRELFRGDHLLRTDDELDIALDGVYRRGEFYLRGLQRVSSLAFGTGIGRFMTQFVVIPFGGALVIVEGVTHLVEKLDWYDEGIDVEAVTQTGHEVASQQHGLDPPAQYSMILVIGLVLMALVHLPAFRNTLAKLLSSLWSVVQLLLWRFPRYLLQFPLVQLMWRSSLITGFRRYVLSPGALAGVLGYVLPAAAGNPPWHPWWIVATAVLFSLVVNSRLGRDTEELVAEWIGTAWHDLRARIVMAAFDWVVDFFKRALSAVERLIYAVDEWLRFHSEETWVSIIAKALIGVVWSFVVFLIRIYVNLLIEPQINPIKHFPVVTVSHKIILPLTFWLQPRIVGVLENFIGSVLANSLVGATLFLLPGVFGFLVWELKGNWRLYATNRVTRLQPIVVGSHGETVPRLLRPGFHSGTLPRAFARLRRLERQSPSFRRFGQRRAWQTVLYHAQRDLRRFVQRDLIRLLEYCPVWQHAELRLAGVEVGCNSILVALKSDSIEGPPVQILFQEQSQWIVATVAEPGLLRNVTREQLHSFDTALLGFYRKAGIEIVRELVERNLVGEHRYDVCSDGLVIWPAAEFDREITVDLHRPHQVRPEPTMLAVTYGISPVSVESVLFFTSNTNWYEWGRLWQVDSEQNDRNQLPLACVQSAGMSLLRHL